MRVPGKIFLIHLFNCETYIKLFHILSWSDKQNNNSSNIRWRPGLCSGQLDKSPALRPTNRPHDRRTVRFLLLVRTYLSNINDKIIWDPTHYQWLTPYWAQTPVPEILVSDKYADRQLTLHIRQTRDYIYLYRPDMGRPLHTLWSLDKRTVDYFRPL